MLIAAIIVSIVLATGLIYFIYRSYILAGLLVDSEEYCNELENHLDLVNSVVIEAYDEMQSIDNKNIFEKDDEVGTTFQLLKQVITDMKEFTNAPKEEQEKSILD